MVDASRLLLVDSSNLFYRNANTHKNLTHKGKYTGGVYGYIVGLAYLVNRTKATEVVVCKDSKPYARTLDFSDYKAGRSRSTNEERFKDLKKNQALVGELLDLISCGVCEHPGFEADDIMAILAKRHQYTHTEIILGSNDSDLHQLLDQDNLSIYLGSTKGYYNKRSFFSEYPTLTDCTQWSLVVAIAGSHNGVPGVHGVGVKTAVQILVDRSVKAKHQEALDKYRTVIRRNKHLCKLPYPPLKHLEKEVKIVRSSEPYKERDVIRFLARYGITMTGTMAQAFALIAEGSSAAS